MSNNAFGLPRMKKDVQNAATHARTGSPAGYQAPAATPQASEAQNYQQEAMQAIERQQQSGGLMKGY